MDCVTDAYVTLGHQWCCVTLTCVENMLIRLCAGIYIHVFAIGNSTIDLVNQVYTVPFDTLLACELFSQTARQQSIKRCFVFLIFLD